MSGANFNPNQYSQAADAMTVSNEANGALIDAQQEHANAEAALSEIRKNEGPTAGQPGAQGAAAPDAAKPQNAPSLDVAGTANALMGTRFSGQNPNRTEDAMVAGKALDLAGMMIGIPPGILSGLTLVAVETMGGGNKNKGSKFAAVNDGLGKGKSDVTMDVEKRLKTTGTGYSAEKPKAMSIFGDGPSKMTNFGTLFAASPGERPASDRVAVGPSAGSRKPGEIAQASELFAASPEGGAARPQISSRDIAADVTNTSAFLSGVSQFRQMPVNDSSRLVAELTARGLAARTKIDQATSLQAAARREMEMGPGQHIIAGATFIPDALDVALRNGNQRAENAMMMRASQAPSGPKFSTSSSQDRS